QASQLLKENYQRSAALDNLKPFLPDTVWAEAQRIEAQRINERVPSSRGGFKSAGEPSAQVIPSSVDVEELRREAWSADTSPDRIREILEMVAAWDNYQDVQIIGALASRADLSHDRIREILEILTRWEWYYALSILK